MDNGTILQNYKDSQNNNNSYTYLKVIYKALYGRYRITIRLSMVKYRVTGKYTG